MKKYLSPHDWLNKEMANWDREKLLKIIKDLSNHLPKSKIEYLFSDEMEKDGFYKKE